MTKKPVRHPVDPEYGVDARYKSRPEQEEAGMLLMEARLERLRKVPKEQLLRAKLLQLKLQMEDFLQPAEGTPKKHFGYFLARYVDAIYTQRNQFARDIHVTPVLLSQVIHRHREPNEELILKLMIHSGKVFKKVGAFHENIWYQVYFHQKLYDIMASQRQWRPGLEKQVKLPESIRSFA